MTELILASQNKHKRDEINAILGNEIKIITLGEFSFFDELEESHDTLEANALQKSRFAYERFKKDCFSEDTGLEVSSLNGAPGVKSARYAGEDKKAADNIDLLLTNMKGVKDRTAQFRTVIALIFDQKDYLFEGICRGKIAMEPSGSSGFGYDPIFIPDGYAQTFAEMDISLKNGISHRSKAINKLKNFLAEFLKHRA